VAGLTERIVDLVTNSPPDKTEQLAASIKTLSVPYDFQTLSHWATNPAAKDRLESLIQSWRSTDVTALELAGMLIGAGEAYHRAAAEQKIELVWTGPSSKLIPTRHTEQALLQVIDAAKSRLFITSFVVYDVASIANALVGATGRGVQVSMLLEGSDRHGGSVSIDGIGKMRALLPQIKLLSWIEKSDGFAGGKVHAKVAVADESICFVSSANLTGHAMERNMEAGILVKGGAVPRDLHRHLEALETTRIVTRV
jgi:cardiolipin synthase A/B